LHNPTLFDGGMKRHLLFAGLAVLLIGAALIQLSRADVGVHIARTTLHGTPLTVYAPAEGHRGPAVLIAHGFAGSQQLMQSFALTLARNGYVAVTFDFPGHGRNPEPLTGSITDPNGATRVLVDEMKSLAGFARSTGDGRLALLGHSMASDIVVRLAEETPDIAATIAVSLFSPAVMADAPRNLLVIAGDWEGTLKHEALRVVGLASAPAAPEPGVTYGDPALGTGRRAAFSAHVEHVSVLFSQDSTREAVLWLDRVFEINRPQPPLLDARGPWILLLIAGVVLLAQPLSTRLPRVSAAPAGAALSWRRLCMPLIVPMLATPLFLRVVPTHFLPVLVGDYLAVHFAVYGLLTTLCLAWAQRARIAVHNPVSRTALAAASVCVIGYGFIALAWPIDRYVTSFAPGRERWVLVLAMLVGTLAYFLSDEWLTRGARAARGAYLASKLAFVVSVGLAVALDVERLFFLIIIVPVIVLFFLVYGMFSRWAYASTGHPFVAGFANAVAFAWAIGVTFPLLAG
jgi:pimeloyl-ACP methyl ester carboxylesterase